MNHLKPNHERARIAVTLIWVMFALSIVALVSEYFQYNLLTNAANGVSIPDDVANANDSREQLIGIVFIIANIISAVTFIQWFRRAYNNMHYLSGGGKYGEGWAAGGWFVPILNWFRPYEIMAEMYGKAKSLLSIRQSTSFVGWWWAFWVLGNIAGSVSLQFVRHATTVDDYMTYTLFAMIQSVLMIPGAILAAKVIRHYSVMEDLLSEIANKPDSQ